jgi:hypothetical protein
MKEEIFSKIVDLYNTYYKFNSVTFTDEYEVYTFENSHQCSQDFDTMKEKAKMFLKKGSCVKPEDKGYGCFKKFISVVYNKKRQSISSSSLLVEYRYSRNQNRYLPIRRKDYQFCYSDKLYTFMYIRNKRCIRIATPSNIDKNIFNIVTGTTADIEYTAIPYNYYIGTNSHWEALSKYVKAPIPKALHRFHVNDVHNLYKVMKDKNEINKLCQFIAKTPLPGWTGLYDTLSRMMLESMTHTWLIRDWIADHVTLKKKLSLKITSEKRIMDEHLRMSRQIQLRGIKDISVKPIYKKIMKNFPIDKVELIADKDRLMKEGIEMEHCVASYAQMINRGQCCILSIPYEGERYTAEIGFTGRMMADNNSHSEYKLKQLRGFRNKPAPEGLVNEVTNYLSKYTIDNRTDLDKFLDEVELPF